jgi:hypothetical protein
MPWRLEHGMLLRNTFRFRSGRSPSSGSTEYDVRPGEKLMALSIMYQSERQDKGNNVLAGLALVAAALAYLGIASILLSDGKLPGGPWVASLLAFPLWVAASFQVLLAWNGQIISESIRTIESRLEDIIGDGENQESRPSTRSTVNQPGAMKIQAFISFGGIWVVIVAFSIVCLAEASTKADWGSAPIIVAAAIYVLSFAGNMIGWLLISRR